MYNIYICIYKTKQVFVGFRSVSSQTWPQDPYRRARHNKLAQTHLKSTPQTNPTSMAATLTRIQLGYRSGYKSLSRVMSGL